MDVTATIRDRILRREPSPGEFDVYQAALEWDLTDPIVIENRDDLKSEHRWKDRIAPYHHQADDVGLGKTISGGLIISELAARARIARVLVVAPNGIRKSRRFARTSWWRTQSGETSLRYL
jgi:hypothetical protein